MNRFSKLAGAAVLSVFTVACSNNDAKPETMFSDGVLINEIKMKAIPKIESAKKRYIETFSPNEEELINFTVAFLNAHIVLGSHEFAAKKGWTPRLQQEFAVTMSVLFDELTTAIQRARLDIEKDEDLRMLGLSETEAATFKSIMGSVFFIEPKQSPPLNPSQRIPT